MLGRGIHTTARRWLLLACLLSALAVPSGAVAYTTSSGFTARDYATGFSSLACCNWGPIGLAFDQSDNLYVANSADGHIYRFAPGGGAASDSTRVTRAPLGGGPSGLAVGRDGRLYLARYGAGDVVEVAAGTGEIVRSVAKVPCATGLVVDPASGDLFVSQNQCGSTIWRISGFANGPGTASAYVSNVYGVDGMSFGNDGTLYAVSNGQVSRIGGTASGSPGAVTPIVYIRGADGVAAGVAPAGGGPAFVVVNRNDGAVTRADLTANPITKGDIFTGGSRGDFAAVDSSGCLYITQTASIVRVRPSDHACDLSPSTTGPPPSQPGVVMDVLTPLRALRTSCSASARRLVIRLRQRGRVRFRSAAIYVAGRRVTVVRGKRVTAPIVLRGLPRGTFTLKIVATTTRGKRVTTRRRVSVCRG